ncbi:hypothetical protein [Kitasatospora sp. NPDC017646]|uniref:hypothetical protein n=1 Tax=Kitasatospora sp. NPDC017646 TaxID=3364024 RepID=UPI00379D4B04
MPARRTRLSAATVLLVGALALVGWLLGGRDHPSTGSAAPGTSPLENPDSTEPGLAPRST